MSKLLYITNQICGPGGLERVLSIKTKYLIDTFGYEIHVITLNQGGKELFYEFHENIKIHDITLNNRNPIIYLKEYRNSIKAILKTVEPNILLVCDDGLKGLIAPVIIGKPCPMVYERHVSKNATLQIRAFLSHF